MDYHEYGKFVLRVKVTIEPKWVMPPETLADAAGREQTENRMAALGDQVAQWIGEALMSKETPEEWAEVSHRLGLALREPR